MRILHVTNAFPYPDVPEYGVFVREQIEALKGAGIECDVFFMNARVEGKGAYLSAIRTLRTQARDYDVVHCHHLYSGLVALLARVTVPVVLSFQNDWLREVEIPNRTAQWMLCNIGARYADRVIFKSPIPPQFRGNPKFVHLQNGVNYDAFAISSKTEARVRLQLDPHARYLLFVSSKDQFRPQKRYDRFAKTLELVRSHNPKLDVRELIMVNQPRERVSDFFNAADVHLLCSDFEGSPNSVKEALCTGLQVVTTLVGNTAEMVQGVPGCAVATSFDPIELAGLVAHALALGPDREATRAGFLAKGLSQNAATEKLRTLYTNVLCKPSPAGEVT